jgi:hypothetical protein
MNADNPQCDGAGPHSVNLEVRRYPTGGVGAAILCRACVARENAFRAELQRDAGYSAESAASFPLRRWFALEVYE